MPVSVANQVPIKRVNSKLLHFSPSSICFVVIEADRGQELLKVFRHPSLAAILFPSLVVWLCLNKGHLWHSFRKY